MRGALDTRLPGASLISRRSFKDATLTRRVNFHCQSKAASVPADKRCWLDDRKCLSYWGAKRRRQMKDLAVKIADAGHFDGVRCSTSSW